MTDNELLELLVQTRERMDRILLDHVRSYDRLAEKINDVWANQAGGNE